MWLFCYIFLYLFLNINLHDIVPTWAISHCNTYIFFLLWAALLWLCKFSSGHCCTFFLFLENIFSWDYFGLNTTDIFSYFLSSSLRPNISFTMRWQDPNRIHLCLHVVQQCKLKVLLKLSCFKNICMLEKCA